jgi:hypothetical protein
MLVDFQDGIALTASAVLAATVAEGLKVENPNRR